MLVFQVKPFSALSADELYEVLRLRAEVFVVEQDCVYQDIDGKDTDALHVLGYDNGVLVAYSRIFDKGLYFDKVSIGRVLVKQSLRKYGYGHDLMKKSLSVISEKYNADSVEISAQLYLKQFYESHNFIQVGSPYLEDGIAHIRMIRS